MSDFTTDYENNECFRESTQDRCWTLASVIGDMEAFEKRRHEKETKPEKEAQSHVETEQDLIKKSQNEKPEETKESNLREQFEKEIPRKLQMKILANMNMPSESYGDLLKFSQKKADACLEASIKQLKDEKDKFFALFQERKIVYVNGLREYVASKNRNNKLLRKLVNEGICEFDKHFEFCNEKFEKRQERELEYEKKNNELQLSKHFELLLSVLISYYKEQQMKEIASLQTSFKCLWNGLQNINEAQAPLKDLNTIFYDISTQDTSSTNDLKYIREKMEILSTLFTGPGFGSISQGICTSAEELIKAQNKIADFSKHLISQEVETRSIANSIHEEFQDLTIFGTYKLQKRNKLKQVQNQLELASNTKEEESETVSLGWMTLPEVQSNFQQFENLTSNYYLDDYYHLKFLYQRHQANIAQMNTINGHTPLYRTVSNKRSYECFKNPHNVSILGRVNSYRFKEGTLRVSLVKPSDSIPGFYSPAFSLGTINDPFFQQCQIIESGFLLLIDIEDCLASMKHVAGNSAKNDELKALEGIVSFFNERIVGIVTRKPKLFPILCEKWGKLILRFLRLIRFQDLYFSTVLDNIFEISLVSETNVLVFKKSPFSAITLQFKQRKWNFATFHKFLGIICKSVDNWHATLSTKFGIEMFCTLITLVSKNYKNIPEYGRFLSSITALFDPKFRSPLTDFVSRNCEKHNINKEDNFVIDEIAQLLSDAFLAIER